MTVTGSYGAGQRIDSLSPVTSARHGSGSPLYAGVAVRTLTATAPSTHRTGQFAADPAGHGVHGGRQDEHGDPEHPHLRLVADAGGEEQPIGRAREKDERDQGEDGCAERGP